MRPALRDEFEGWVEQARWSLGQLVSGNSCRWRGSQDVGGDLAAGADVAVVAGGSDRERDGALWGDVRPGVALR